MDKLDLINRKKNMQGNMIKWWNVNMISNEANESYSSESDASTDQDITDVTEYSENDLCDRILAENSRANVFEKLSQNYSEINFNENENTVDVNEESDDLVDRANEIYQRLLAEALEDENKKQKEIEAAFESQMAQVL